MATFTPIPTTGFTTNLDANISAEINFLCQSPVSVGSPLFLISYLILTIFGNPKSDPEIETEWRTVGPKNEELLMAACNMTSCSNFLNQNTDQATLWPWSGGAFGSAIISDSVQIKGFVSSYNITSARTNDAGQWMVTWLVDGTLYDHVCNVNVLDQSYTSMICPSSYVGYPVQLMASYPKNVSSGEFFILRWAMESGKGTIAECFGNNVCESWFPSRAFATVYKNEFGYFESELVLVGDRQYNGTWTTNWSFQDDGFIDSCNVSIQFMDPSKDCLEPVFTYTTNDNSSSYGSRLQVTLACFTYNITNIRVKGNYSLVFGKEKKFVKQSSTAQYIFESTQVKPLLLLNFDFTIVLGETESTIHRYAQYQIPSKVAIPTPGSINIVIADEFTPVDGVLMTFPHAHHSYAVEITKSFPFPYEAHFEVENLSSGNHQLILTKPFTHWQQELFDYKFQYEMTDLQSKYKTHHLAYVFPRVHKSFQCMADIFVQFKSNITILSQFQLPCMVFTTNGLFTFSFGSQNLQLSSQQQGSKIQMEVLSSVSMEIIARSKIVFFYSTGTTSTMTVSITRKLIPPTPEYVILVQDSYYTKIYFQVGATFDELQELVTTGVVESFYLKIHPDSFISEHNRYRVINSTQSGKRDYNLVFEVPPLNPQTMYTFNLIVIGHGVNSTGLPTTVITKRDRPLIRSSRSSIVPPGGDVTLNCSSRNFVPAFEWYHFGRLLEGENTFQLKLTANQDTNGVYNCGYLDGRNGELSEDYFLMVTQPDINSIAMQLDITIDKKWISALESSLTLEYMSFEVYIVAMIREGMRSDQFITTFDVGSISQRQGSIAFNVGYFFEHMNQTFLPQSLSFLNTALELGLADFFYLRRSDIFLRGIFWKGPDAIPIRIIEEQPLVIECNFSITHSTDPAFNVMWLINGSVIHPSRASTFDFKNSKRVFTGRSDWMFLGPMKIFHYNYKLIIQQFTPRLIGSFGCEVEMTSPILPPPLNDRNELQTLFLSEKHLIRKPTVIIDPPFLQVKDPLRDVQVRCTFTEGFDVVLLNSDDQEIGTKLREPIPKPSIGGKEAIFTLKPVEQSVKCHVKSNFDDFFDVKSDFCHIQVIKKGTDLCDDSVDYRGLTWDSTAVGITVTKICPAGYSGTVTRKCEMNGTWGKSNYLQCTREDLKLVIEKIEGIINDGLDPTSTQIREISDSVNSSITSPEPILSSDIIQVVKILDDVGKAVFDDSQDVGDELVDSRSFENFVSVADAVLSTDESEWEEIITSSDEESYDVGQKLVVAMDKLVSSTLSSTSYSSDPIVKKSVAIKRDKIGITDIAFPDVNENGYEKFDSWVIDSGNEVFLSSNNFKNVQEPVQYAVIVYNRMDSKFVVDPSEQEKYSTTQGLKGKKVASDVTCFSISSKKVSTFNPPLKLQFRVGNNNYSKPVCGYLDTTLGRRPVWSSKGCQTIDIGSEFVECKCDHLTNFAILMSPSGISETSEHHEILTLITYVGCGISLVCLLITIILHVLTWKYVSDDRAMLHFHLCVVLMLAYVTFLGGINQIDHDIVCTVVAALLHFFFLTVFFIMLAEGFHMLLTVTFVFSKESYLNRLLFMAYFCPLAIVGICLGLTRTDGYRHPEFCWLSIDSGLLWGFVGPALFVILLNFIVLGITLNAMLSSVSMKSKDTITRTKASIRAIFILSPIFGLTWVFGVFSVNETFIVFQYLFAIFNSLQGFLIFLIYGVLSRQIKDGLKHSSRKRKARSFGSEDNAFMSVGKQHSETTSQQRLRESSSSDRSRSSGSTSSALYSDTSNSQRSSSGQPYYANRTSIQPIRGSQLDKNKKDVAMMNPAFIHEDAHIYDQIQ